MVRVRTKKETKLLANPKKELLTGLTGKARSLANLKPNPGGEIRNPTGKNGGAVKICFWPFVCAYIGMTDAQLKTIERNEAMTMAKKGAMSFARKFGDGQLSVMLEVLNREIGPPASKPLTSPEEQAALAREYLRQMQASVPEKEAGANAA